MRKSFAICDPALDGKAVATLHYDSENKKFHISIDRSADVPKLPISLKMHAEMGRFDLNDSFSMDWIHARMCPAYRHNISSILKNLGLSEYDEFAILMKTAGKSLMDDLYLDGIVSLI
ncbi:MAG: hypothetical protein LBH09_02670 [Peptococcaceae bacterium]|jgi:hypothetical protein|nr:hypothetical protein [Peptococcaceae bacterium]